MVICPRTPSMKGDDNHSTTPNTVKLNVGGKLYETSRSFIKQNEGSMLARLVSNTWHGDPSEPIFIDRDGDTFAHVLNHLRYGSIELPNGIPESMFRRELDYYGVASIEDECVRQSTSIGTMKRIKRRAHDASSITTC